MAKDVKLLTQPECRHRNSQTFKECVIAHWSSDVAPKISGAKLCTEAVGCSNTSVEEQCVNDEAKGVSRRGDYTRENAGMSSER